MQQGVKLHGVMKEEVIKVEVLTKKEVLRLIGKHKSSKTEIVNRRPNSLQFRYAGTGSDVKIYFEDAEDLVKQLQAINENSEVVKKELDNIKGKFQEVE